MEVAVGRALIKKPKTPLIRKDESQIMMLMIMMAMIIMLLIT